jgi:hypothetical protein
MAAKSYTEGYSEDQLARIKELESQKIGWGGYVAVVFAIVFFYGVWDTIYDR